MAQDINPTSERDFDIILFGASSFVGKTTARYIKANHPELTVALAARGAGRVNGLKLGYPVIVADAMDAEAMDALAKRAKVIITTVGPYTRYGDNLVAACAQNGTGYVDLCGEALFIRRSIDNWHEVAQETGARIVHSCGFDSVPSDMGMFYLHQHANRPLTEVTMAVERLSGGLSGGTIDSMREVSADAKRMPKGGAILHSPHSLSPDHKQEPDLGPEPDRFVEYDELVGQWVGPFFMAMFNTRVVRRSNSLMNHAYGERLRYREAMTTGQGLLGQAKAKLLHAATVAGFALIMIPGLRKPLSRFIPEPGDGPKDIEKGGFTIAHYGKDEDGHVYVTEVSAEGDPGYKTTAMMLTEAAVTLVNHPGEGGVLTPATALDAPYIEALDSHGMRFRVRQ